LRNLQSLRVNKVNAGNIDSGLINYSLRVLFAIKARLPSLKLPPFTGEWQMSEEEEDITSFQPHQAD